MIARRRTVLRVVGIGLCLAGIAGLFDDRLQTGERQSAARATAAHPGAPASTRLSIGRGQAGQAADSPLAGERRFTPLPLAGASPLPPLPFEFVGRIDTDGAPSIVLQRGGRVFTVAAPGPLDDEYDVEAILDDHLVLHHAALSARQFLPLARRQSAAQIANAGSPDDYPQD